MAYLSELRDSCLLCVRKHLGQALVLMQEARQGHPLHRWIAVGHMGEAADEALKVFPELAAEIRKHRLRYMGDANYVVPIMDLIEKATNLVKQEGRVDMLPGGKGDKLDEKDVDPAELARGIEVELEHTKNRRLAKEIALDHLAEDPRYYTKLKRIHSESDKPPRRNQRRAQIGDSSDKEAFYASLRRKGDDAIAFIKRNDGDVVRTRRNNPYTRAGTRNSVHNSFTPSKSDDLSLKERQARERARPQIEEREINPDGSTSCGVFIPIPYDLARQFPDKKMEDDSIPHFTVLYAGALSPDDFRKLVTTVRAIALAVKPFWLDLARYGEFVNSTGQVVAHMMPGPSGSSNLARLHGILRRGLEAVGVKIEHHYGPGDKAEMIHVPYEVRFRPHATLAYLPPIQPYTGPKPTGSWLVNEIEVWGHERIRIPLGSIDYSDSGAKLQRSALDMQLYMTRKSYPRAVPLPVRSPLDGGK